MTAADAIDSGGDEWPAQPGRDHVVSAVVEQSDRIASVIDDADDERVGCGSAGVAGPGIGHVDQDDIGRGRVPCVSPPRVGDDDPSFGLVERRT